MSLPTGPGLDLMEATETVISVSFKPLSTPTNYELQWKEYSQTWETGLQSTKVEPGSNTKKVKVEAQPLDPGKTYCVRLVCISSDGTGKGQPGPELIIDTEQVGCTPKSGGGRCIVS